MSEEKRAELVDELEKVRTWITGAAYHNHNIKLRDRRLAKASVVQRAINALEPQPPAPTLESVDVGWFHAQGCLPMRYFTKHSDGCPKLELIANGWTPAQLRAIAADMDRRAGG